MGMAAAVWDVLAKAANLAQMSGLDAAMLVVGLTALLRVLQSNMRECTRLERCTRRLHALLQWPASSRVALLLSCSETAGDPFAEALQDAARLVDSYKGSSLWRRLWGGRRMTTQLRDMHDVVDSYCGLLLFVNAHHLLQRQATHHPPSPTTSTTYVNVTYKSKIPEVNDDTSQSPSAQVVTSRPAVKGSQRSNADIGQGETDYDPATESERNLPADQLTIVISHDTEGLN